MKTPSNKKRKMIRLLILAVLISNLFLNAVVFIPGAAAADTSKTSFTDFQGGLQAPSPTGYSESLTQSSDVRSFILNVVNFFLQFLGLIAVIVIIYGGVMYVIDMGKGESQGKAKKAITYAITGLLIVLSSYAIVNTVLQSPGAGTSNKGSATGVTASTSFNRLAAAVKSTSKDIENTYTWEFAADQTLFEAKTAMDGVLAPVMTCDTQYKSNADSSEPSSECDPNTVLAQFQSKLDNVSSLMNNISITFPSFQSNLELGDNSMGSAIDSFNTTLKNFESTALANARNEISRTQAVAKKSESDCRLAGAGAVGIVSGLGSAATNVGSTVIGQGGNSSGDLCAVKNRPNYSNLVKALLGDYYTGGFGTLDGQDSTANDKSIGKRFIIAKKLIKHQFENVVIGTEKLIKDIYLVVAPITDIAQTNFSALIFENMLKSTGAVAGNDNKTWIDTETGPNEKLLAKLRNSLNTYITDDKEHIMPDSTVEPGPSFSNAISELSVLYDRLKDLKFVDAKLTASTLEGNAPLVVDFSSIGSTNPNGKTIENDQITWDMFGVGITPASLDNPDTNQFDILTGNPPDGKFMNCEKGLIHTQTATCTYLFPGTYRVTLRIKPAKTNSGNDIDPVTGNPYNKEIGAGVSTIIIKVNPPQTRINMKVTHGSKEENVISYDKDGFLSLNKDSVPVLSSEAQTGITFDATLTKAQNGDDFSKQASDGATIKWDFGDGTAESRAKSTTTSTTVIAAESASSTNLKKTHSYTKDGTYTVKVEFTDKNKIVDRKIFDIVVGPIVAEIDTPDQEYQLNEDVVFDGSNSRADSAQIKTYEWSCDPECPATDMTPKGAGTPEEKMAIKFKTPQKDGYKVTLKVTDNADPSRTGEAKTTIYIPSKPPVAKFTYSFPDKATPQLVRFDASSSYSPDPTNKIASYEWKVDGAASSAITYPNGPSGVTAGPDMSIAMIRFSALNTYKVSLTVKDVLDQTSTYEKQVEITSLLNIAVSPDSNFSTSLGSAAGGGNINIGLLSEGANSYEIDFGDGTAKKTGAMPYRLDPANPTHTYTEAGTYMMTARVFDADNNENSLVHKIFVNSSKEPTPIISIKKNGEDYFPVNGDTIEANRKDVFTFDAGQSINTDGSSRRLNYSWKFGFAKDGLSGLQPISTKKTFNKTFGDIGEYIIALDATNADKVTEKSSVPDGYKVVVKGEYPTLSGLTAVPTGTSLVTPVQVLVKAIDAIDPDGEIVSYKWWYYNDDDQVERGIQVSQSPQATLIIGTRGKEGVEVPYKFGVALTDNDNNTIKVMECSAQNQPDATDNESVLCVDQLPVLRVINGPNKEPIAKFDVDRTSINVGDSVSFISSSSDPDGQIKAYYWDWEGDGFANNTKDEGSNPTHVFTKAAKSGIKVRLKVVDNNDSEAISDPVTIYVEGNTQPPIAAFVSAQQGTTMKVDFKDNSTADTANGAYIKSWSWDFDTTNLDSNGDGKKDNDIDSTTQNPSNEYTTYGIKRAKLTVTDSEGNIATVTNFVNVKAPVPATPTQQVTTPPKTTIVTQQVVVPAPTPLKPAAPETTAPALDARLITVPSANVKDGKIHIKGDSGTIILDYSTSVGNITKYVIDKNILFDSNGNGNPADDEDYTATTPGKWETDFQKAWGSITVRLTVFDSSGKKDFVDKTVVFDAGTSAAATLTSSTPTSNPGMISVFGIDINDLGAVLVSIMGFAILGSIISRISKANK